MREAMGNLHARLDELETVAHRHEFGGAGGETEDEGEDGAEDDSLDGWYEDENDE